MTSRAGGYLELATLLLEAGADPDEPLLSPFAYGARMKSARKLASEWDQQTMLDLFDEWKAAETSNENIE